MKKSPRANNETRRDTRARGRRRGRRERAVVSSSQSDARCLAYISASLDITAGGSGDPHQARISGAQHTYTSPQPLQRRQRRREQMSVLWRSKWRRSRRCQHCHWSVIRGSGACVAVGIVEALRRRTSRCFGLPRAAVESAARCSCCRAEVVWRCLSFGLKAHVLRTLCLTLQLLCESMPYSVLHEFRLWKRYMYSLQESTALVA